MRWIIITAALSGALCIVIGAVSQHAANMAGGHDLIQTGLRYHQIHSIVLLILGFASMHGSYNKMLKVAAGLFAAGIVLFSFSLYISAIFGIPGLTMMTPVGGMVFIAAWLCLAFVRVEEQKP